MVLCGAFLALLAFVARAEFLEQTPVPFEYDLSQETLSTRQLWSTTNVAPTLNSERRGPNQIATFGDSAYVVYIDSTLRLRMLKLKMDGTARSETYLSSDFNFVTREGSTYVYSIGVDELGYVHVAGDMLSYNFRGFAIAHLTEKWKHQKCLMWRSYEPESIDMGFTGSSPAGCVPSEGTTMVSFFNDLSGRLYAIYGVHAGSPGDTRGAMGVAVSRYCTASNRWEDLNALVRDGNTALVFEPPAEYKEYVSVHVTGEHVAMFDRNDVMHIGVLTPGDPELLEQFSYAIYAYSDDYGDTFKRSDGSVIDLPMRIFSDGNDKADIVYHKPGEAISHVGVTALADGTPVVGVRQFSDTDFWKTLKSDKSGKWIEKTGVGAPGFTVTARFLADMLGVQTMLHSGIRLYRTYDPTDEFVEHRYDYGRPSVDSGHMMRTGNVLFLTQRNNGAVGSTMMLILVEIERPGGVQYPSFEVTTTTQPPPTPTSAPPPLTPPPPGAVPPDGAPYHISEERYQISKIFTATDARPGVGFFSGDVSPVATSAGDYSYFAYVNDNGFPVVGEAKIGTGSAPTVTVLDDDVRFLKGVGQVSVGVDEGGFIHVAAGMSEYPEEHTSQYFIDVSMRSKSCLLWRSTSSESIRSFRFVGGSDEGCPYGRGFSSYRFFNDNQGQLYFSSRVLGGYPKAPVAAFDISRYNADRSEWERIGAFSHCCRTALFTAGGDGSRISGWASFDGDDILHVAAAEFGDEGGPIQHLGYAKSYDKGRTFVKADESPVKLPMRFEKDDAHRPAIVAESPSLGPDVSVVGDLHGRPVVAFSREGQDGMAFARLEEDGWTEMEDPMMPQKSDFARLYSDKYGVITAPSQGTTIARMWSPGEGSGFIDVGATDLALDAQHLARTGDILYLGVEDGSVVFGIVRIARPLATAVAPI